jgi:hypothetical protein
MMVGFVGRTGAGDRSGRIFFKSNQHDPLGAGVGAIWKSTLARGDPGSDAHEEPNNECRTVRWISPGAAAYFDSTPPASRPSSGIT